MSHHAISQPLGPATNGQTPPASAPLPSHLSASSTVASLAVAEAAANAVSQYRPLNVKDALSYLDQVKIQFSDQPEVYNRFLDIMKDFKSQRYIAITSNTMDTPGVIDRVSTLFRGHPNLIMGFNTFLPPGYKIEPTNNPDNPVRVTTPRDHPPYVHHPQPPMPTQTNLADVAGASAAAVSAANTMANYFSNPGSYGSGGSLPPISSMSQHNGNQYSASAGASNLINAMHAHGVQSQGGRGDKNTKAPVEFNHAINYVNKIKNRFSTEPDTYKHFLEILQTYQKEQKPIHDVRTSGLAHGLPSSTSDESLDDQVYAQVQVLFKGAPDLLEEFKQFLPDTNNGQGQGGLAGLGRSGLMPMLGTMANGMAVPQVPGGGRYAGDYGNGGKRPSLGSSGSKKHKRPTSGQGAGGGVGGSGGSLSLSQPPKKKVKTAKVEKPGTIEELEFFDKCKRIINNKSVYNEFLKVLNLFSQEIIESKVLIDRVEPFLSKAPELFEWFKKFVKYEEDDIIYNIPAERPDINPDQLQRAGHSYRLLPSNVRILAVYVHIMHDIDRFFAYQLPKLTCTGRDDIGAEVLNDQWISHPFFQSESGFLSHKKTQYEEALHKCEEERYEFDLNIEANLHTIGLLEPIAKRIQLMSLEEKAKFRLPEGLGGSSKTIYKRVIKKIYDKDRGAEVIEALHNNPAVAVPVVLKRLKQKDEEWKRAQREWSKVWREIDAKNYYKALDHQGISFKATDRKAVSNKALIAEIETIFREQQEKPTKLASRYQFDFSFKDQDVFLDVRRLLRLQIKSLQFNDNEEEKLLDFSRSFVRKFFLLDNRIEDEEEEDESDDESEAVESDTEMEEDVVSTRAKNRSNSLRRNLFARKRATNGGGGRSTRRSRTAVDNVDAMDTDDDVAGDGDTESISEFGGRPSGAAAARGKEAEGTPANSTDNVTDDVSMTDKDTVGDARPRKRGTYVLYGNNTFYVFFRLYQILYSRLLKMKELSRDLAQNPPRAEKLNPVAVELGLQKATNVVPSQDRDRYGELLRAIRAFLNCDLETNEYEEKARSLFGTSAYLVFTIDRVVQSVVKQMQTILTDSKCTDLLSLYTKDRDQPTTSSRQEAVYRLSAESLIQDENMYRLEYFVPERVLTFQLLGKDDHISDETISSEEKWSLYVDHFVQLPSTEGVRAKRREPFLKRNLPPEVTEDPVTNIETRSGLELKICVNTYKIFFVDNTEDYFRRKRGGAAGSLLGLSPDERKKAEEKANVARRQKFRAWLEGPRGWRGSGKKEGVDEPASRFESWAAGSGDGKCSIKTISDGGGEHRMFELPQVSLGDGQPVGSKEPQPDAP
ncbi:Transcriptional regulatory protein sin3 [Borealophlyctis nickersoniae]|nr:Transcriptional regulatory protein sin3 [Borealophlyctis nickersoniae]